MGGVAVGAASHLARALQAEPFAEPDQRNRIGRAKVSDDLAEKCIQLVFIHCILPHSIGDC